MASVVLTESRPITACLGVALERRGGVTVRLPATHGQRVRADFATAVPHARPRSEWKQSAAELLELARAMVPAHVSPDPDPIADASIFDAAEAIAQVAIMTALAAQLVPMLLSGAPSWAQNRVLARCVLVGGAPAEEPPGGYPQGLDFAYVDAADLGWTELPPILQEHARRVLSNGRPDVVMPIIVSRLARRQAGGVPSTSLWLLLLPGAWKRGGRVCARCGRMAEHGEPAATHFAACADETYRLNSAELRTCTVRDATQATPAVEGAAAAPAVVLPAVAAAAAPAASPPATGPPAAGPPAADPPAASLSAADPPATDLSATTVGTSATSTGSEHVIQ